MILVLLALSFRPLLYCSVDNNNSWSLTLREESRLRVFENRILRRIFGPKREGMGSGEGSTMRNFIICSSPNIVKVTRTKILRWSGHVTRMEEGRSAFKMLIGKPTGTNFRKA